MPTITSEDAVLIAADNLAKALNGDIPQSNETQEGIKRLQEILNTKAAELDREREAAVSDIGPPSQRVFETSTQRASSRAPTQRVPSRTPTQRVTDGPAARTRARQGETRTLEEDFAMTMMELESTDDMLTPQRTAARKFPLAFLCKWAGATRFGDPVEWMQAVMDPESGNMLNYRQLKKKDPQTKTVWEYSFGNEIGRLAQGMPGRTEGTNTIHFIGKNEVPKDRMRDVTYASIVCTERPQKAEKERTRLVGGGNLINSTIDCGTPTADLLTVKLLLNSIISTPGAKMACFNVKNFYLNTPMERYEYLRMHIDDFPEDVIEHYNLREKATAEGYLYMEVRKGMYGLPQAGIIAQELLEKRLNKYGYFQSKLTPGFWTHKTRPICFTLVVDDFGIKYVGEEHAMHLLNALQEHYEVETDWTAEKYLGITLDWDYDNGQVHLSMPGYVTKALVRFQHELKQLQHSPHPHEAKNYGAKVQYAKPDDDSQPLDKEGKRFVQQVCGTFLYYGRAVDGTMLMPLSAIASDQANPTEATMRKVQQFLDYAATHPDAVLTYKASDMILAVHSDASYLNEPKARSRVGGHFFMTNDTDELPNNGAVLNIAQIIKHVMSSAAEAELGGLYINAREAIPARIVLEEMKHKQPPTPIQTDNSTACGVVNSNIQPKRTKAMDMRFHWLRDREAQEQFRTFWKPGVTNLADYWTKHHCPAHHKEMRPVFLTPSAFANALRKALGKAPHKF